MNWAPTTTKVRNGMAVTLKEVVEEMMYVITQIRKRRGDELKTCNVLMDRQ